MYDIYIYTYINGDSGDPKWHNSIGGIADQILIVCNDGSFIGKEKQMYQHPTCKWFSIPTMIVWLISI